MPAPYSIPCSLPIRERKKNYGCSTSLTSHCLTPLSYDPITIFIMSLPLLSLLTSVAQFIPIPNLFKFINVSSAVVTACTPPLRLRSQSFHVQDLLAPLAPTRCPSMMPLLSLFKFSYIF